jgi:hypothetical protein
VRTDDPYAALGSSVEQSPPENGVAEPAHSVASPVAPAADEFSKIGEPAQVVDTSTTEQGFADELPQQTASRLSPDDEKEYVRILSQEPVDEAGSKARRFLASKGLIAGPPADGDKAFPDSIEQTIAYRRKHGIVNKAVDYLKPEPLPDDGIAGSAARGIADVPTMGFMDELYGVAQAIQNPSGYGIEHDINANIDKYRGTVDRDEKEHPIARIAGQLFGGLGIPLSYEGVAFDAGRTAMQEARAAGTAWDETLQLGRRAAAKAARNAMVRDGAYIGGAHGVGSGEGAGRLSEGAAEAGLGAAGGAVVGLAGEALAPGMAASRATARSAPLTGEQELINAADRQGITNILPADVGGPITRRATSMVSQTIAGGKPVIDTAQNMNAEAKAARDRIASAIGQALEPEAAGQQAITGAQKAIQSTANDARVFYSGAEKASAGEKIDAPKALDTLDRNISELAETPGGAPGLTTLQGLRDALAQGNLTVSGIRRMRTVLRDQFVKEGLTGSDLERRVNQVVDAAAEDVRDGLSAAGKPDAASLFAQGDAAWRSRAKLIDDTIAPIIGKDGSKSGEQVIKTLTADLQGNNARAVRFLKALPINEQSNVRASIIGALGRAKAGKQGSEGSEFSLDTFLTNWNQIGETAKNAYFGPEARSALNDLAKVAEGTREAQGYRNMSNTGGVVGNLLTLMSGAGGILTFGKTVGAQYALGRLLASPRFARWLARAPKTSLSGHAYIDRLGRIAKAEPAIAADVLSLQQRLTEAFSTAPMRAAASDDSGDSGQKPQ